MRCFNCHNELEKNYILQKKALNSSTLSKRETFEQEKKSIEEKLAKKNDHYKSLYEDKLEGIITQEDFLMFREKFSKEIENYKKRIEIINEELENIKSKEENIKTSKNIFEKYRHIDKLTKEIVDEFVDVIKIGKINKNEREVKIWQ